MVFLHDDETPHYDDQTIKVQLQQFFDEWHYRVLHSGVATTTDRVSCLKLALDIFEMQGVTMTPEEKNEYMNMEDEEAMITAMVQHMPFEARKTFEHFVLQLQLVISTTTQVRHALEEGIPEEVAKCFEGGEMGPGQQILKATIVEAGKQIHSAIENQKSWKANTETRIGRLQKSSEEAEHYSQQLFAVQMQLDAFKGEQNAKSKSVLMGMSEKNDKQLVHAVFSGWFGWLLQHKADKDIHDYFKQMIQDAEDALIAFKKKQLGISKGMLARNAAQGDAGLMGEVMRIWYKYVIVEGHTRGMEADLAAQQERLKSMKDSQKANSKAVMARMSAGNDAALISLCFQTWGQALEELKKDREIDAAAKAAEAQYKEFMAKKKENGAGVLERMSDASDSGLIHHMFVLWQEIWKEAKEGAAMQALMQENEAKFKSLAGKQKGNAMSAASKANRLEEENTLLCFLLYWHTESRVQHVIKHYGGKLDQKTNQLVAVQDMFRSFANQLEAGMGSQTPRSRRSKAGSEAGPPAASGSQAGGDGGSQAAA